MAKFFIHVFIVLLVLYIFVAPTNKPLYVEEKGILLWKELQQKYRNILSSEKRAVKYITPRGHL